MRDYKKFGVWQKSHELTLVIYKEVAPYFPDFEKYGLASQIRRSAYSIPFNIAEGCGRNSDKDFTHFLDMSLGSIHELEYCIMLTNELLYIDEKKIIELSEKINEIKAMTINLIRKIRMRNAERGTGNG